MAGGGRLLLKLLQICLHQSFRVQHALLRAISGSSGRIVEFPAIVGRAEQRHKRATCEEFVAVFHNLMGGHVSPETMPNGLPFDGCTVESRKNVTCF